MAGLPAAPGPLHWHLSRIVIAEKMDLHLVWTPDEVFIKTASPILARPGLLVSAPLLLGRALW